MPRFITICIAATLFFSSCATKKTIVKSPSYRTWGMIGATIQDHFNEILVTGVYSNSPAEKAGLRKDDIIKSCNGLQIESTRKLILFIKSRKTGSFISLGIKRDTSHLLLRLKIGNFPLDKQLLKMAFNAARGLDFTRALELIQVIEKKWKTGQVATRAAALKRKILARLK